MKNISIGHRLKFDNINPEDLETFILNYIKLYNRYEIKVTKELLSSGKVELLLNISEKIAKGKYSLHVFKDVLNNPDSYDMLQELIKVLSKFDTSNEIFLITHIPQKNILSYLSKIFDISKILPRNYILLLENIVCENKNEGYLKQINTLCCILKANNINNVAICLDIGHLLFGFNKENISEGKAISLLEEMPYILSKITEIHIHDYCEKDHMKLKEGTMNLESVSNFIKNNGLNVPIILEVNVNEFSVDGIAQIAIIKKLCKS
ncbi:MAG: hypothetical protein IKT41_02215 [Clostridia bacterium]|nr:hypothetical protein [Clostridia bacterium]